MWSGGQRWLLCLGLVALFGTAGCGFYRAGPTGAPGSEAAIAAEVEAAFEAAERAIVEEDFDAWWNLLSEDYIEFYSDPRNYPDGYPIRNLLDWFHLMKVEIRHRYNDGDPLEADAVQVVGPDAAVVYATLRQMREMGWDPKPAAFFVREEGGWKYGTERELRALGWNPGQDRSRLTTARSRQEDSD